MPARHPATSTDTSESSECRMRAAKAVGWILVAALAYLVVTGLLLDGLVNVINEAYSVRDTRTAEGVHQPTGSLRSGGPGSLVPWDSLGWQGRNFIGKGPTASDIEKFTGHPAMGPIRAYAGLASAADTESRADLAVQDLSREGGFQRKNLLVVTTTGSGWVDPALADSFEYLSGGDSAIVAIQYSYLPSWVSYLVDQSKAREAGRDLFDAVYGDWSKLPPGDRPRLFVAGESLGSFGGETAFSGENDLANHHGRGVACVHVSLGARARRDLAVPAPLAAQGRHRGGRADDVAGPACLERCHRPACW